MHRRLRPKLHRLHYSVFSMLVDVDRLPGRSRQLALFSHNRFNFFSICEQDHGAGGDLKSYLTKTARGARHQLHLTFFDAVLSAYPRICLQPADSLLWCRCRRSHRRHHL
ncbi:MAG: DUF1365 domain-containing protein [Hyphomicrobiales bacterium]|nr:DUF1365 domain-containing protein [Hyphomicrobiales bacterium]